MRRPYCVLQFSVIKYGLKLAYIINTIFKPSRVNQLSIKIYNSKKEYSLIRIYEVLYSLQFRGPKIVIHCSLDFVAS